MTASLRQLRLSVLPESFAIFRLPPDAAIPTWAASGPFFSLTRTADELSIVVEQSRIPADVQAQGGWRAIKVLGPFELTEVGVLASLANPLAAAKISLFVVSTFDTDYLLVAAQALPAAIVVLQNAGHVFSPTISS
ncbi:MAG TPA: ACT domain-containing protein [Candidatus Methylomirabilis sp.]|nr:ACT domain-containing protein [Candidatus Methylomirabilis sp.]